MAFGFEVRNAANNIVIDDTASAFYVVREFAVAKNYTLPAGKGFPDMGRFVPSLTYPDSFFAVKFNDGDEIFAGPRQFYSNRSTLTFRELTLFSQNAPPSDPYGIEVKDEAGKLTYSTARSLSPINRVVQFAATSGNRTVGYGEVYGSLTVAAGAERWVLFAPVGCGSFKTRLAVDKADIHLLLGGLVRTSSTNFQYRAWYANRKTVNAMYDNSFSMSSQQIVTFL